MLMPKVSRILASRFVKPYELSYTDRRSAMIDKVTVEMFGNDQVEKLVATVSDGDGWEKDLVLNQTNLQRLATAYGDDTDGWDGQLVELWVVDVVYHGDTVQSTQIGPAPPPALPAPPATPRLPLDKDLDDDIPF
jgi:hypothetical protein